MFKIRNKSTGLFSTGGANPNFTKMGKAFLTYRALKLHYNVINTSGGRHTVNSMLVLDAYKNCEVVEYSITELDTHEIGIKNE